MSGYRGRCESGLTQANRVEKTPRRPGIIMEGPLVSDTTELLSDADPASEDSPSGHPAADSAASAPRSSGRHGGDLSKLRVSDLQGLAQQLGISGTARMRKGDLVAAIQERQGGGRSTPRSGAGPAGRPSGTPGSAAPGGSSRPPESGRYGSRYIHPVRHR